MSTPEEQKEKHDIAYYTATVNAWFNTRLEHDKSLLTLSSAGIGLLISLVSKFAISSAEGLIIYVLALVAFVLCLIAVLWIYKQNSQHLEDIHQNKATNDRILTVLDTVAIFTFIAGIVFSSILAVSAAINSFETKDTRMSPEDKGKNQPRTLLNDSFNRAIGMQPTTVDTLSKSFTGAARLKPDAAPQQQTTTPIPAPAPAQNANTGVKKP